MAEVYKVSENELACFTKGLNYAGFLNGLETELNKDPVRLCCGTLNVGDRIVGFDSPNNRTSFLLNYDFMTFRGSRGSALYFDIYDSKSKGVQGNLFEQRPVWMLEFQKVDETCLLSFSQPGAGWDIRPNKIVRYESPNGQNINQ